ncbi:MAG: trypsin-like serine protease [Halobacteriovoraceae bacterium]|jgi:V8-like Glu-specific endopeptidase|nr:trypsin-like serine protease [Halobacteriovoraceae bacterium]
MTKSLLILSILISTSSFAATKGIKVIYGDDNRVDVIDSTNAMYVELSQSTAAMIGKRNVSKPASGVISIKGSTLESMGMCKSERFSQQPTAASCSGFLVGEDLLVTAGHCMQRQSDCNNNKWVFDYKIESKAKASISVSESSVYSCKKIINQVLNNSNQDDFAIIQLDRKVTGRRVLDYRRSGKIKKNQDIVVIGHPTGLPTKIADGAVVRSLSKKYFSANLDTYGGNSGSAVFNADTGVIEGILVRGATDYVYDSSQGCRVSNVLSNTSGRGEDVTYITNIPELQN